MTRMFLTLTAVFGLAAAATPGEAKAQNTGLQTIGLASFSPADVTKTGDAVIAAARTRTGEYEVTCLPHTFAPANPYSNLTRLVQHTIPKLPAGARLRVTAYMWFHRWDPRFDWTAFTAARPNPGQRQFLATYLGRVAAFDQWATGIRAWADNNRLGGRLALTLSPYLEDDAPNRASYTALLGKVLDQQARDGVRTQLRRSSLDNNIFRATTPAGGSIALEIHGRWAAVVNAATLAGVRLGRDDSFSNDGIELTADQFLRDQASARAAGLNVYFWRAPYNGLPSGLHPNQRGTLRPFTGPSGVAEYAAAVRVMSSR
jgi:hypothetical protein